eukprot:UN07180
MSVVDELQGFGVLPRFHENKWTCDVDLSLIL